MPDLIRCFDNRNQPIVDDSSDVLSLSYFNLLHLTKRQPHGQQLHRMFRSSASKGALLATPRGLTL